MEKVYKIASGHRDANLKAIDMYMKHTDPKENKSITNNFIQINNATIKQEDLNALEPNVLAQIESLIKYNRTTTIKIGDDEINI